MLPRVPLASIVPWGYGRLVAGAVTSLALAALRGAPAGPRGTAP